MKKVVGAKGKVPTAKKKAAPAKAAPVAKKKIEGAKKPVSAKRPQTPKRAAPPKIKPPVIKHPNDQTILIHEDVPDVQDVFTIEYVYGKALDDPGFRERLIADPKTACDEYQILLTDDDMSKLVDILTVKYNDTNTGAEYLAYVGSVRDHFDNDRGGDPPKFPPPAPW